MLLTCCWFTLIPPLRDNKGSFYSICLWYITDLNLALKVNCEGFSGTCWQSGRLQLAKQKQIIMPQLCKQSKLEMGSR